MKRKTSKKKKEVMNTSLTSSSTRCFYLLPASASLQENEQNKQNEKKNK
jgi:hypothetical protein